jgi:hypothetical protein
VGLLAIAINATPVLASPASTRVSIRAVLLAFDFSEEEIANLLASAPCPRGIIGRKKPSSSDSSNSLRKNQY